MRPNFFTDYDRYAVQQTEAFDSWDDTSQYAPTPGNFRRSPASPSDISYTSIPYQSYISDANCFAKE